MIVLGGKTSVRQLDHESSTHRNGIFFYKRDPLESEAHPQIPVLLTTLISNLLKLEKSEKTSWLFKLLCLCNLWQ